MVICSNIPPNLLVIKQISNDCGNAEDYNFFVVAGLNPF
jgi:hypothetical protein